MTHSRMFLTAAFALAACPGIAFADDDEGNRRWRDRPSVGQVMIGELLGYDARHIWREDRRWSRDDDDDDRHTRRWRDRDDDDDDDD